MTFLPDLDLEEEAKAEASEKEILQLTTLFKQVGDAEEEEVVDLAD